MNADKEKVLIIISEDEELEWIQIVQKAWQPLGKIAVVTEAASMENDISTIQQSSFIIIDASSTRCDLVSLIKELHIQNERVPIVVASASPTWEQARDIFHAGAAEYIKRTTNVQSLVRLFKSHTDRGSPKNE